MFKLLLFVALLAVTSLAASDISGTWLGSMETTGSKVSIQLKLEQRGQELQGTLATGDPTKPLSIVNGQIHDNQVTFDVRDNSGRTLQFRLTVTDHLISGEMNDGTQVSKVTLPWTNNRQGGGSSAAPILIYKTEPQYTDEARAARVQGTVVVQVELNESGTVSPDHIKVLRSLGSGLDEKAIETVKQWRFKPALKDGSPVAVTVTIELNFRLDR